MNSTTQELKYKQSILKYQKQKELFNSMTLFLYFMNKI